jgi:pimeloyl-ACP methyl ester carboxylesterase
MGLSTYQSRRRVMDWPSDVTQLADHLALGRFAVVGFSGGGPYALACAYGLADRVTACGLVASVGRVSRAVAFLAGWLPWVMTAAVRPMFADPQRAERSLHRFASRWIAQDRDVLAQPEVSGLMAAALAEAFRQGARGAAYEGTLFGRGWGFPLAAVTLPAVWSWHGALDRDVPAAVAQAMAAELPTCTATVYPQEGHISLIVNHDDKIVSTLTRAEPAG